MPTVVDEDTLDVLGTRFVRRRAARPTIVSDGATGYCRCGICDGPIDPWDRFCRHCGSDVLTDEWHGGDGDA